jgi:hypothetical protein
MTTHFAPASERQTAFISSLLSDRTVPVTYSENISERMSEGILTSREASQAIDYLKGLPKRPGAHAHAVDLPLGIYTVGEEIWRVGVSRTTGRKYAARLRGNLLTMDAKPVFDWVKGGLGILAREGERKSLEWAEAWGLQHGWCICCDAFLTDPASVARGIGPVCAKKYF